MGVENIDASYLVNLVTKASVPRHLYVVNGGENTVSMFKIDVSSGRLSDNGIDIT